MPGRAEERYESNLPILLSGGTGISRNVSASGIYFETESRLRKGARFDFSIDFKNPQGEPVRMRCEGQIVRVEPLAGRMIGVGARINKFKVERMEASAT